MSIQDIKDQHTSFLEDQLDKVHANYKSLSEDHDRALSEWRQHQANGRKQHEEIRDLQRKLKESQATVKAQNDTITRFKEQHERWGWDNENGFAVARIMTTTVNIRNKPHPQEFELSTTKKKNDVLVEENTKMKTQYERTLEEGDAEIEKLEAEIAKAQKSLGESDVLGGEEGQSWSQAWLIR